MGKPMGRPNFAQVTAQLAAKGIRPAASTGRVHLRFEAPPRPRANQAATKRAPMVHAYPAGARLRFAARISTPLAVTRPHDGRSRTPSRAKMLPVVRAALQAKSSL